MPATSGKHLSASRKVVTDFPASLFQRTERAAHELSMNRSRLIRLAVETFLRQMDREQLERAVAESLTANIEMNAQLMEEFKYVDAESSDL